MYKNIRKGIAIACSTLILMPSLTSMNVYAGEENTIVKEEKVYGLLNADGTTESLVVSNYIHSGVELTELKDASSLDNIMNLKNGDVPEIDDDKLTWSMDGYELYYQGTTEQALPVTTEIEYKINGKTISPEDLDGVTGQLEIRITQENHVSELIEVNGEERELYVPFYTLVTLGLKTKTFSNVEINKGKIVNDGNYFLVVGGLMPGMKENLGENEYIEFEEEIVITAEVNDYQKPPMYLVMSTEIPSDQDLEIFDTLNELDEKILSFDQAADELEAGGIEFYNAESQYLDGLDSAFNGLYDLNSGIKSLADNMAPLQVGFTTLISGVADFARGATEFSAAVTEVSNGLGQLVGGIGQVTSGLTDLNSQTASLSAGLHQEDESLAILYQGFTAYGSQLDQESVAYAQYSELLEGLKLASGGAKELSTAFDNYGVGVATLEAGATNLLTSSETLMAVPEVLNQKAELLTKGAMALTNGGTEISGGITQLTTGVSQLAAGSQTITDGISILDDKSSDLLIGARSLRDGISKFNLEGVKVITKEIKDKETEFNDMVELYEALEIMAANYTNFSGGTDEMDQKVEFILKVNE